MADDERRAEIEAVVEAAQAVVDTQAAIVRACTPSDPEFLHAQGPNMVPEECDRYAALFSRWHSTTRNLAAVLDRVRDARRDDEAQDRGHDFGPSGGDTCNLCGLPKSSHAARSPRGEDHEARVETVARILGRGGWRDEDGVWHEGITVRDWSRAADIVAALDDLSRVSPSRDGTVAVEALRAIRTFAGEGPHTRMGEACGIDACIGCLIYATADGALAECSRSSSDRPEQPEPDALGGLPPSQPKEDG